MRPVVWRPPVEPSPAEQAVIRLVRRAKLFVFLREYRHELFDEVFQAELARAYVDSAKGQPPVPPAQLALATVLQAYTRVSDDEVIEATVMDRRWQLVLDCTGAEEPPFSKGTLVGFRKRLIEHDLDRRLIERTVDLAARTKGFGAAALRAALDSSPLWGAGRVEDTINLMGHALRKALGVIAVLQGRGQAAGVTVVAEQAGTPELAASSLKAALDRDWDDPAARDEALAAVLGLLGRVEAFIAGQVAVRPQPRRPRPPARSATRTSTWRARRRRCGAGWPKTGGSASRTARCGMDASRARCCSTGTSGTCCATWTPAWCPSWGSPRPTRRKPASPATSPPTWTPPGSPWPNCTSTGPTCPRTWSATVRRAWRSTARPGGSATPGRFAKDQFTLDFTAGQLTCPAGVAMPFEPGRTVRFPKGTCAACPLQARCTTSSNGRSVSIHPDEALLAELRQRQQVPEGRAKLRERVAVEHALAHIGHWQGRRARYRGTRKNLFDLRRAAVVHNLHVIARQPDDSDYQMAA